MAETVIIHEASALKETLDNLYRTFNFTESIRRDPIRFPMKYKRKSDIEATAFISSALAYGRVDLFMPVIEKILSPMGASPADFLFHFDSGRDGKIFSGISYRFNRPRDIAGLLYVIGTLIRTFGGVEGAFRSFYREEDYNTGNALSGMMEHISKVDMTPVFGKDIRPNGFMQFFPSPAKGSACKRANLFLRWMVRDRDIDFGIWKGIPKKKLVIPLDTHIARVSRCLGFTKRKSADYKMAVEITGALKALDAQDPLKYDFALCHQGISGLCRARGCKECALKHGIS